MRGQPNNEPDSQTLSLMHPRPHKSYTGVVYLYASRSAPIDVLNLIFKARFTQFRGWPSLGSQNSQQKNTRAQSWPCGSFSAYLGDRGSRFSRCCLKNPVLGLLARPQEVVSHDVCICYQHYGIVYEVKTTFNQSIGLKPRKTLNWGSLFCAVLFPFVQYARNGPPR